MFEYPNRASVRSRSKQLRNKIVLIGGAVLLSQLHQDPRYFYQGTGSGKSRAIQAMSYAIICKGDNGRSQFNYSGIGGNLFFLPSRGVQMLSARIGEFDTPLVTK
jgi:hypothetical protein